MLSTTECQKGNFLDINVFVWTGSLMCLRFPLHSFFIIRQKSNSTSSSQTKTVCSLLCLKSQQHLKHKQLIHSCFSDIFNVTP